MRAWSVMTACAAIAAVAAVDLRAEEPAIPDELPVRRPLTLTIYGENDGEYFKPNDSTDRYYTSGVGVSLSFHADWVDSLQAYMPFHESFGPAKTAAGVVVAQHIFTPEDIETSAPQPEDRPWAGYLYAGVYWQREASLGRNAATLDHFQLDVGVVGPSSLAEDAQIWIHDLFDDPEPLGWDNQLRDEPTLQLTVRKKWRLDVLGGDEAVLFHEPPTDGQVLGRGVVGVQILPEVGGSVGNVHRYLEAGGTVRAGWNLPDDFGPARLTHVGSATGRGERRGLSAYAFARASGRVVEHNLFLEGNTWRDSPSVDAEPLVGELQVGFVIAHAWRNWTAAVGYSQTFQTDEFEDQDGSHAYGAYTLRVTGWF